MKVNLNKSMIGMISNIAFREAQKNSSLIEIADNIQKMAIIKVNDCYFWANNLRTIPEFSADKFFDKTGWECFVNHIHMEDLNALDYLTPERISMNGFYALLLLANKLNELFINTNFRIIITSSENSCIIRFHKIRNNEYWIDSDLEKYAYESIAVIEI